MAGPSVSLPVAKTPRILFEHPAILDLALVKSPKSCASPVVAIVTYSIRFTIFEFAGESPPATTALVELDAPAHSSRGAVKLPKSCAFPVV